jgi:DNA-binding MarR family transcriptional regulator
MSVKAIDWALESALPTGPRFVLFVLGNRAGDHSGEDWTCYPGVQTIMRDTGMSRATVERHLATLWAEGWISRKRRVRPDGRLGIYDYTLHRRAEHRAQLRAQRQGLEQPAEGDEPCSNLQHGPGVTLDGAMPQNEAQPCLKLQHVEPSLNPQKNPQSAREPGDFGFERAWEAYPRRGQKRTNVPEARAAWALACSTVHPDRLQAAVEAFAKDPDQLKGDFGACGFCRWLNEERWRAWLPAAGPAAGGQQANGVRPCWPGPADIRAQVVALKGEDWTRSWLDHGGWDGAAVIGGTRTAAAALREVMRPMGLLVKDPARAPAEQV